MLCVVIPEVEDGDLSYFEGFGVERSLERNRRVTLLKLQNIPVTNELYHLSATVPPWVARNLTLDPSFFRGRDRSQNHTVPQKGAIVEPAVENAHL